MKKYKLFYLLLGCTPIGRHTEQHDVFFCIGESLSSLKHYIAAFWPDAGKIHIDAWREVTNVDGYAIKVFERKEAASKNENLFFINLGGYLPNSFEEHHYKCLAIAKDIGAAIQAAKQTPFYKQYNTPNGKAVSHVDDKYGVDVDEVLNVEDILPATQKGKFMLQILKEDTQQPDELHIGYLKWDNIE
ncbi:MAG: DUF1543 domain-containing protein [Niabella sp.]